VRLVLADKLEEWWSERTDPEGFEPEYFVKVMVPIITDVGSTWRIDWQHIAESALED
jgi:hypothetical protein